MSVYNIERETTLLIKTRAPLSIAESIRSLSEIGEYCLYSPYTINIYDVYIDTADALLRKGGFALRLRRAEPRGMNSSAKNPGDVHTNTARSDAPYRGTFLTLKGRTTKTSSGAIERIEIEEPASEESFSKVAKTLRTFKIHIPQLGAPIDWKNASSLVENLGLTVIQNRLNIRAVRKISLKEKAKPEALAELVVDKVEFQIAGSRLIHHEVEIEAITPTDRDVLHDVAKALKHMYKDILISWEHNKLATGKALEELTRTVPAKALIDSQGNVKPGTYDKIDMLLKQNGR